MAASTFRLALIQMAVGANKAENVKRAVEFVQEAAKQKAQMVVLPECFNGPLGTQHFLNYAETFPGQTTTALSVAAKENNVYLVGGSIPEEDGGKYYNTCAVFNPSGKMVAKHRKAHLFDIDVPGGIRFQESEVLTRGDSLTVFDTPFCKVGVGICYDIRFSDMAQIYADNGCKLLVYPGAFNMTTGPVHWELLNRCRALDNQVYCCSVSPSRDESATYVAWGHTMAVNPWGKVLCEAQEKEEMLFVDIDLEYLNQVRQSVPLTLQRRTDLYNRPTAKK